MIGKSIRMMKNETETNGKTDKIAYSKVPLNEEDKHPKKLVPFD